MAKTSTSFLVCYIDSNGEKQIKNINDLTFEERGSIEKMAILNRGKASTIGNFTSALSAKKNDKGEIVRIGFPNLKVLYGPAGVASISVEALRKATVCPSLQNYVGIAKGGENIAPRFVESSGVAIDSEETPTKAGAFAIVSTKKDEVSKFISEDDFYASVIVDNGKVASSVVTIKVNPSKADLMQGPKTPGVLRQKADEIRATQEIKSNTASILNVVSALNDNGVSLSDEQKRGLLSSFEAFVIANKGLSKEEAEAMKRGLQEDIYGTGVKLADNITSSKNEILDKLQTASKKAEQTSANDRAVNFAEHSKTRTTIANEGKRTTQETVDALKEYLSSEDFAKFVAESTPVDKVLGGIEKITGEQNNDIAYLLQEVGVNLSAPQIDRLSEAFKDGLEDSATSTAKTVQDMINFATNAVKEQMTVEGVKLSTEQESRFIDGLSKRFLEERILNEKTISDVVGKATSATIASMESVFARLDNELVSGFAMTSEDIINTSERTQGVVAAEGTKTRETIADLGNKVDDSMVGLRAGIDNVDKKADAQLEKISSYEAVIKELKQQLAESEQKIDALMTLQARTEKRLEQLVNQNAKQGEVLYAQINAIAEGLKQIMPNRSGMNNNGTLVGQNVAQQSVDTNSGVTKQDISQGINVQQLAEIVNKIVDDKFAKLSGSDSLVKPSEQNIREVAKKDNSQTSAKTKSENNQPQEKPTKKADDKNKEEKSEPKKIKVLKKEAKLAGMLAEPKLPWYKRMGKFIIRHPFRSVLIGLGAGALIATGAGAFALGGLAPAIATANAFAPTILGGAVAGAGLGVVGSIASRISRKGRRERAYTKFMKKYNKALKRLDKVHTKDAKIEELNAEIKDLREKHRSGTLLSKLGVYKACRSVKKQVLRAKRRTLEKDVDKYSKIVDKASDLKDKLNVLEAKSGKTNAIGGYVAKRDKLYTKSFKGKITPEERVEDLEDLDYELAGMYGKKPSISIAEVTDTYKTGDTEMANLVEHFTNKNTIKNRVKPSHKANATMEAIKHRNTRIFEVEAEEDIIPPVTPEEMKRAAGDVNKLIELEARSRRAKIQEEQAERYARVHSDERGM